MVCHARLRQTAFGVGIAVDAAHRILMPTDVECRKLREKIQRTVWQVVMNPPCHVGPLATARDVVHQPGNDDARSSTVQPFGIGVVPDMSSVVGLIAGAVEPFPVAKIIHRR